MFGLKHKAEVNLFKEVTDWDQDRLRFTPDYPIISKKKSLLLFVHDDMMQLQPHHSLIQQGSLSGFYPLDYGYTSKKFSFIKKELGLNSFPVALDLKDKGELPQYMADEYRIRGEIYAIRPQQFILLDIHRQNGVQFRRIPVNINIGSRKLWEKYYFTAEGQKRYTYDLGKEEMCTQEMMMYVGIEEYWKDQLHAGFFDFKPIDIITEDRLWLKEYYQYSRVT